MTLVDTSTSLNIIPYEARHAPDLAAAYNRITLHVPYCYPISGEDFAAAAAPRPDAEGEQRLHSEAIFVAVKEDSVLGYAHAAIGIPHHHAKIETGVVRFLWYEPGRRYAGQALLETVQTHLAQNRMTHIIAYPQGHRYPFYHLPAAYLSDHLGHLGALFGQNGYRRTHGEVFMDWMDYPLPKPVAPQTELEVNVEWRQKPDTPPANAPSYWPRFVLRAHQGEQEVGECHTVPLSDYTNDPAAQDRFFVTWIGVNDESQGRGVGRYLLQRALLEMRNAGFRHATISTARHNYRAALFYTNLGFRVVDWTYACERDL
jgi:ribosomal protein S18 acetylase RimI-like enzyme